MCEPERSSLNDVRDVDAVLGPVAEKFLNLVASFVPEDDADLGDPRLLEVLDGVLEDGLVRDGDELLRSRVRDRTEPGPSST